MYTSLKRSMERAVRGDTLKARMIRSSLGSAGIQATNRILALVLGVVLARTLGAESYGIYAFAFAIMSLLMVVAEAGVPTLLMREVAASQGQAEWGVLRGVLRRGTQFVTLMATIVSSLGFVVLWWFADALQPALYFTLALMLLVLPMSALAKTVVYGILGLHRVVVGQAVDMLIRPLLVLFVIVAVFLAWPELRRPQIAMAVQLFGAIVVLLVGAQVLKRLLPAEIKKAAPEYKARQWLKSALPFTVIGGASIINTQADMIMIGWLMGSEDVGMYRVSVQGSMLVAFGLQAANAVVAPQFSRLYAQGDMVKLQRLVTQSARAILAVALPLAAAFILAGEVILSWVFGEEYGPAHLSLAILAVGQLINAWFGSVGFLLNMTGQEGVVARILLLTASINIAFNLVLIPLFGLAGAAIAATVSLILWNVLLYRQVQARLGIHSTAIRLFAS